MKKWLASLRNVFLKKIFPVTIKIVHPAVYVFLGWYLSQLSAKGAFYRAERLAKAKAVNTLILELISNDGAAREILQAAKEGHMVPTAYATRFFSTTAIDSWIAQGTGYFNDRAQSVLLWDIYTGLHVIVLLENECKNANKSNLQKDLSAVVDNCKLYDEKVFELIPVLVAMNDVSRKEFPDLHFPSIFLRGHNIFFSLAS